MSLVRVRGYKREEKPVGYISIYDIGSKYLFGDTLDDFVRFFDTRFPNEGSTSYADEWARRFARGTEWVSADSKSKSVLRQVNPLKYANRKKIARKR